MLRQNIVIATHRFLNPVSDYQLRGADPLVLAARNDEACGWESKYDVCWGYVEVTGDKYPNYLYVVVKCLLVI